MAERILSVSSAVLERSAGARVRPMVSVGVACGWGPGVTSPKSRSVGMRAGRAG